LTENDKFELKD